MCSSDLPAFKPPFLLLNPFQELPLAHILFEVLHLKAKELIFCVELCLEPKGEFAVGEVLCPVHLSATAIWIVETAACSSWLVHVARDVVEALICRRCRWGSCVIVPIIDGEPGIRWS